MTKEELEKFEEIQDIFQTRCETICRILSPLDEAYKHVYEFEINGDDIYGQGDEHWQYGGYEKHYAEFPKKYIYMDDKEIQKIVDTELKDRTIKKAMEILRESNLKIESEKAEYERLKKIYG